MNRLLVLRPEPGASATVEQARKRGLDAIAVPLFTIVSVDWEAPNPACFDALLVTSANAIRGAGNELSRLAALPVHAVGQATADAAAKIGLHVASTGRGGVDELLQDLPGSLRLLHLCGSDRRGPASAVQSITAVPVYRAMPSENPRLGDVKDCVALIHSPRAGSRFAELIDDRNRITIAAISPAAADAVGTGWRAVESAQEPNEEALLALAERLCNNLPR